MKGTAMGNERFDFAASAPGASADAETWTDLGELIGQLVTELVDEVSQDPDSVVAAVVLFGGSRRPFDVSRN